MRESDEAGRTAERATGQGIIREKETGGWLRVVERNEEGCDYGFVPCGRVVSDNSFIVSDICFSI